MEKQTKKSWQQPQLEVLNVNMTMAGPGVRLPDDIQPDPTEVIHYS
ncbi:hypothetical protein PAT3040_03500 [Paenibacillus agaridevorans]|jgi:hypothetical protein|uniref:Paeninodin family lasso peptide n=1 Tax=Paenibacillus agaridevorans TaxID=171404 RepID=A0A2R5EV13_9BACL|nr:MULTISPECIES: paeninodin family lasso peptide [Paenibacillus]GBG08888.1 hypothetical protein PAT3040_03500 [Paenibacillus agaridevorans]